MPDHESSLVRNAQSARSYEGIEHPANATAARRSWPRWSGTATAQKIPSARSCGGFECHAVALALEELDRATRDALAVLPIAVIGTKLSIDRVIRQDGPLAGAATGES